MIRRKDLGDIEAYEFDIGLRLVSLASSVPADWEQDFKKSITRRAKISLERRAQLTDILEELARPEKKKSAATADAVTLGDVFLGPAIQRGLLQPFASPEEEPWWDCLSPRWQRLVRRDGQGRPSASSPVYAVPYRWGCTLVAYRTDKLNSREFLMSHSRGSRAIEDWGDLLQPALKGRLGFSQAPREFVGIALKTLGLPFNATPADHAECKFPLGKLQQRVTELKEQVLQVSNRELQQSLAAGDTWAAVGPSSDLVPLALRNNNVALAAPASGTALWADLWAVPRAAQGGSSHVSSPPLPPPYRLPNKFKS